MKKQSTTKATKRRLVLSSERIRQLDEHQLKNAAAGAGDCTSMEPNCERTTMAI